MAASNWDHPMPSGQSVRQTNRFTKLKGRRKFGLKPVLYDPLDYLHPRIMREALRYKNKRG